MFEINNKTLSDAVYIYLHIFVDVPNLIYLQIG